MEIITKKIICDRCHKKLESNVYTVFDNVYSYQLCDDCKKIFDNYKRTKRLALIKLDNIEKSFKFGEYLPKYQEKENE